MIDRPLNFVHTLYTADVARWNSFFIEK